MREKEVTCQYNDMYVTTHNLGSTIHNANHTNENIRKSYKQISIKP